MAARLVPVDDPGDPRLSDYAALTDARLRKRYEHASGVLIAEGPNPVAALIASPYPVRSLLLAEERVDASHQLLIRVGSEVSAYVVPREVLYELVRFRLHQGVLACGGRLPPATLDELLPAHRLLVLEGVGDHENLGTLFRTARGLGVEGVVLGPGCADPLYRRSVRTSMGHVLHVPNVRARATHEVFATLHAAGVATVALTPDPAADTLSSVAASLADGPVAVVLGAEGPGLSADALSGARRRARIPLAGGVDSLNVAAAGAIALHAFSASAAGRGR